MKSEIINSSIVPAPAGTGIMNENPITVNSIIGIKKEISKICIESSNVRYSKYIRIAAIAVYINEIINVFFFFVKNSISSFSMFFSRLMCFSKNFILWTLKNRAIRRIAVLPAVNLKIKNNIRKIPKKPRTRKVISIEYPINENFINMTKKANISITRFNMMSSSLSIIVALRAFGNGSCFLTSQALTGSPPIKANGVM